MQQGRLGLMISVVSQLQLPVIDDRWVGTHGIGRFANEVSTRLHLSPLGLGGSPSSPFEPLRMWLSLFQKSRSSVVFTPGYNVPLFVIRPYIVTIHDLNHIDRPENSSFLKRIYYRYILRRAVRNVARVVTVSGYSRGRILDWAGLPAERVAVVGNGVASQYTPNAIPASLGFDYLLCVSNRKGHKNETRLLEAFAKSDISPDLRLAFTGEPTAELERQIHVLGLENRVVFVGKVKESDMPGLYRGALALLFPSLYEGFGLPVLEAMACGTPVLTSNVTALPEVAGDAALLVDPLSVEAIASGIARLCNDSELRQTLSAKGLIRAQEFTWDAVADKIRAVLEDVEREVAV